MFGFSYVIVTYKWIRLSKLWNTVAGKKSNLLSNKSLKYQEKYI